MDLPLETDVGGATAGDAQAVRILHSLVAQRIKTGRQHQRLGQTAQIVMQQGRCAPVQVVLLVVDVVVVEIRHGVRREQIPLTVGGVRRRTPALVRGGVDK